MYDLQVGEFFGLRLRLRLLFWEEMTGSFFYHMVLILIKRLFYIHLRNKKYLTLLFQRHLKNITARLWMRQERKKIFQCFFIISLLSLIERKRLINIVTVSIFCLLIVQFHLSRAFQKKKENFNPSLLNWTDQDLRKSQVEMLYGVFRRWQNIVIIILREGWFSPCKIKQKDR